MKFQVSVSQWLQLTSGKKNKGAIYERNIFRTKFLEQSDKLLL